MAAKNNLEIHLSATETAQKALALTSPFEVETTSLEAFNADGNDPADWSVWKQMFTERLQHFQLLATQPSPSAQAAKAAAATKPAAS